MAALAKVKNVADVGAEAGRASVSKAGEGLARLAAVAGDARSIRPSRSSAFSPGGPSSRWRFWAMHSAVFLVRCVNH